MKNSSVCRGWQIAVPKHEPVATLTAPIGKPTEEADDAFEKIFSLRPANSCVITANWAVNDRLATQDVRRIILPVNLICFHFASCGPGVFKVRLPNCGLLKNRLKGPLLRLKKISYQVQGICETEIYRSVALDRTQV
jgi:hypothetical protein